MKKRTSPHVGKRALLGKLSAYSTAAGATLVMASGADAAVTLLTPGNMTMTGVSPGAPFTFNFLGTQGVAQVVAGSFSFCIYGANLSDQPAVLRFSDAGSYFQGNGNFVANGGGVLNLPKSATIGTQTNAAQVLLKRGPTFSQTFGFNNFEQPHSTGYVGFRFATLTHQKLYQGWLKVSVSLDAGLPFELTFLSVEGGDQPVFGAYAPLSEQLLVGSLTAVPEPATTAAGLALLALGAAGVRELRRRRKTSVGS